MKLAASLARKVLGSVPQASSKVLSSVAEQFQPLFAKSASQLSVRKAKGMEVLSDRIPWVAKRDFTAVIRDVKLQGAIRQLAFLRKVPQKQKRADTVRLSESTQARLERAEKMLDLIEGLRAASHKMQGGAGLRAGYFTGQLMTAQDLESEQEYQPPDSEQAPGRNRYFSGRLLGSEDLDSEQVAGSSEQVALSEQQRRALQQMFAVSDPLHSTATALVRKKERKKEDEE